MIFEVVRAMYSGVLLLLAVFLLGVLGVGNGLGDYVVNVFGVAFIAAPAVAFHLQDEEDGVINRACSVTFRVIALPHGNLIFRESETGLSSRFVRC